MRVSTAFVGPTQTLLLCFRYQVKKADDQLSVSFTSGKKRIDYSFPYHLHPWPASVPLRLRKGQAVELVFRAESGATLSNGRFLLVGGDEWANVAPTPSPKAGAMKQLEAKDDRNVPRVMVPNIFGLIGDPRREQIAFGTEKTDVYALFDNDPYSGTELFGVEYPLNEWQKTSEWNLRSARVVMEFVKPRNIRGLGIWEHTGAPPAEAYALEFCDEYEVDEMTQELKADWELACAVRRNTHYYHLRAFEPKKAKVWRITILRTPADMQRLAEIELYEETMEDLFDLDAGDDSEDSFDLFE